MRLFISINFDEETKNKIEDLIGILKGYGHGNFTKRNNLHLTLSFLGEVDSKDVEKIKVVMDELSIPNSTIYFKSIGSFNPKLYFLKCDATKNLMAFQKELNTKLRETGFKVEKRSFKPHITLVREPDFKLDYDDIFFKEFTFESNKISLMESTRVNGKLIYKVIYERTSK